MGEAEIRAEWERRFARTVAEEIRSGIHSGALTWGEADELLARLRIVIEQALDHTPIAS